MTLSDTELSLLREIEATGWLVISEDQAQDADMAEAMLARGLLRKAPWSGVKVEAYVLSGLGIRALEDAPGAARSTPPRSL